MFQSCVHFFFSTDIYFLFSPGSNASPAPTDFRDLVSDEWGNLRDEPSDQEALLSNGDQNVTDNQVGIKHNNADINVDINRCQLCGVDQQGQQADWLKVTLLDNGLLDGGGPNLRHVHNPGGEDEASRKWA